MCEQAPCVPHSFQHLMILDAQSNREGFFCLFVCFWFLLWFGLVDFPSSLPHLENMSLLQGWAIWCPALCSPQHPIALETHSRCRYRAQVGLTVPATFRT